MGAGEDGIFGVGVRTGPGRIREGSSALIQRMTATRSRKTSLYGKWRHALRVVVRRDPLHGAMPERKYSGLADPGRVGVIMAAGQGMIVARAGVGGSVA